MARILLVDDEESIRRLLRTALERAGHAVVEARNGEEAIRLNRAAPADLVVTDILMPEKDGVEVIQTLRSECPNAKVIAMSGGGQSRQHEALDIAEPLGAFATVRKPFSLHEVMALVNEALAA